MSPRRHDRPPLPKTRMERVQELLRMNKEVCSLSDLYGAALANGRNDISDLRRRGWEVDTYGTMHHGTPWHTHYMLRSAPSRIASAKQEAGAYNFSLFKTR